MRLEINTQKRFVGEGTIYRKREAGWGRDASKGLESSGTGFPNLHC